MSNPRGRGARYAKVQRKPDANQGDIEKALRRCGASVLDLSSVGGDCPDLLVGFRGIDRLLEVKTATGTPSGGQEVFAREWKGRAVAIVRSELEALAAIGVRIDT
jgi:hypothetical protein